MIETIRQGLQEDGYRVSISQLCRWFDMPRRTMYYKPSRKAPVCRSASASRSNR
jgi:putative transposase